MAIQNKIAGGVSNTLADVDAGNNLKVTLPTDPLYMGGAIQFNENDSGEITGQKFFYSPEVDTDYRQRVSQDLLLDEEPFNGTAQNTGKHLTVVSTHTVGFATGQFTTNSGSSVAGNAYSLFQTYATFPCTGTQTLSCDVEIAFSAQPVTNTFIEFGFGVPQSSTAAPVDGCFFRLSSAGLQGVIVNNNIETASGIFPLSNGTGTWSYVNDKKYQFICYLGGIAAYFWVNNGSGAKLLGTIPLPTAQGRLVASPSLPFFLKHRCPSTAASGVIQAKLGAYNVRIGGSNVSTTPSTQGNRIYGSYQGLSGTTMGSLANYANSANPTAGVPTNTTAVLGTGLGGQFWETATLAANTDGILCSYQVPAINQLNPNKRLVVRGVYLITYVQTTLTVAAAYIRQYSLAFGHTSLSLATTEAVAAKAPRRIALPFTQSVTANQAAGTLVQQASTFCDFGDAPVFVNAGEYIQIAVKQIGTVPSAGVFGHTVTFVYGWE